MISPVDFRRRRRAIEQVGLALAPGGGRVRGGARHPLVHEQAFEHIDRRVERAADRAVLLLAVPAAVLHLLGQEAVDDALHVLAEVVTDRDRRAVDAGLDLAVEEGQVVVLPADVLANLVDRALDDRIFGSTPRSRRTTRVGFVPVHSGKFAPPPHDPSGRWASRSRAPKPSRATRARSASTSSAGASVRSRITCQRIEGSPSSSQSITFMDGLTSTFDGNGRRRRRRPSVMAHDGPQT